MSNTCWCLVNELKNSLYRRWQIWSLMQFHVNLKQILYKYINNFTAIVFVHRTIIQYLLTAEIDTFICLFIYCTFLLAMAVPVHKIFTMFVTKVYACFYVFVTSMFLSTGLYYQAITSWFELVFSVFQLFQVCLFLRFSVFFAKTVLFARVSCKSSSFVIFCRKFPAYSTAVGNELMVRLSSNWDDSIFRIV